MAWEIQEGLRKIRTKNDGPAQKDTTNRRWSASVYSRELGYNPYLPSKASFIKRLLLTKTKGFY